MRPERTLRFEVPTREQLERLVAGPLPLDLRETATGIDAFRLVHFDAPGGDLEHKGATVRLRIGRDGRRTLAVAVRERETEDGVVIRRELAADVPDLPAPDLFAGDSEAARLVRALIDPARLGIAFELEVVRRSRDALAADGAPIRFHFDAVTVRRGDLTGDLQELEVCVDDDDGGRRFDALVRALESEHGLRLTLADTVARARELLAALEIEALEREVRAAREVAVVVHGHGRIALCRSGAGYQIATGSGTGPDACRRALRSWFGRSRGRIRLLGTSPGSGSRPALEVWLAEGVDAGAVEGFDCLWLPLRDVLAMAGTPELRDARTLAALHVVARSELPGHAAPAPATGEAVAAEVEASVEPLVAAAGSAAGIVERATRDVRPDLLLNPDRARLAFNERILVMVEDPRTPLLERVRFLSMFGARLDDFFMTRVAEAKDQVASGAGRRTPDGLSPEEQLEVVRIRARQIARRAYRALRDELLPTLAREGIHVLRWAELDEADRDRLHDAYGAQASAVITPLAADPSHPFPHIRNLRPAIAVIVRLPESQLERFVAIELPGELPRFLQIPGTHVFVPLEEVILASLPRLYAGLEVVRAHTFRVTRSANIRLDDVAARDVLQLVEEEVARRPFRPVVRLEVEDSMPADVRDLILRELQYEVPGVVSTLGDGDVHPVDWLVDLAALRQIAAVDRPDLRFPPHARTVPIPTDRPILDTIRERGRLVRFPDHAFDATVERFLAEAADDPDVLAIKLTLYRTNPASRVVRALARARAAGKEAFALVELKASFDERRNIEWARSLEAAGIHVVFSPLEYKVHAKIALIVRREHDDIRRYVYIGTGNLNAATAASYTDIGLLSADPDLAGEVGAVFNVLTGYSAGAEFRHLLVSPFNMRARFLELIEREIVHARAGRSARIRAQMNGLSDRQMIAALYRASRAGVRIDLAVREICALRPGVPGASENIRVTSLLGRMLQHARIFCFHNDGSPEFFIGSADWRPRNLSRRVEVATPVRDPEHAALLDRALDEIIDHPEAWTLRPDGAYVRGAEVIGGRPIGDEP